VSNVTFPNVGFGLKSIPNSQSIHFKNATLWTNESSELSEFSATVTPALCIIEALYGMASFTSYL
jgi:hypothetical protein